MGILGIYVRTSIDREGTSIDQQKKLGIDFCKKNKFEYQIYEDVGKSGYKIEDEENPFKTRKGLTKLIDDIENKIVDKIWVFEHSRLSRNQYSSFILNRIFEKNNITIYENDKKFDMNNPQNQMIQGILTQISQYERHLIIDRLTRGVHDTINRGIRSFNKLYGYKKGKRNDDGYVIWIPVKSEIEHIKYSFQKYLEGKSLNTIVDSIFKFKNTNNDKMEKDRLNLIQRWRRIITQFCYTGYSLNTEGLELFEKYKNNEIDSISEIKNKKYYVKSVNFPEKIITIDDWIRSVEIFYSHKRLLLYKDKMRSTHTEVLTGIIQCPYCELKYYYSSLYNYKYYRHYPGRICSQKPKSLNIEKMDRLFEVFLFYYYLVFDDTKILIQENQKLIKMNLLEIKDKIKIVETENGKYLKQIERFQSIYEETRDPELLKLTLIKEKELVSKIELNNETIKNLKFNLEELNNKYNQDEMELTFYNVKDTVVNYIEKMKVEEKRMLLIKIIKVCQLFNKYLVIDTGKLLFIFDIKENYMLPKDIYNNFKKDINFKENFLNSSKLIDDNGDLNDDLLEDIKSSYEDLYKKYPENKVKELLEMFSNYGSVRTLGDNIITDYPLNNKDIKSIKVDYEKELQKFGIDYNISGIDKIINFTRSIYFF